MKKPEDWLVQLNDRVRGSLIGGAAGDALGYAIEFHDEEYIFGKYGPSGITEFELINGKALISDDTQMALFTAMACILGSAEPDAASSLTPYRMNLVRCYKDWYLTQTQDFPFFVQH